MDYLILPVIQAGLRAPDLPVHVLVPREPGPAAPDLLPCGVEGGDMKAIALSLVLLGVVAGCARNTSSPSASPGSYTTQTDCERAGYTWTAGTCK